MAEKLFAEEKTMRIVCVRHGEPDYDRDCLTERGRKQAELVAARLQREGISRIYSSPMGRTMETASYTAGLLGLPITEIDYLHEISWGGPGIPDEGHLWTLANRMICEEDFDFHHSEWRVHPYFRENTAVKDYDMIAGKIDAFLAEKGYRHEGSRFFCEAKEQETFAIFGHGGSGACVLSHVLTMPFPYTLTMLPYEFTSVIILEFPVMPGRYVHPRIELFNDTAHNLEVTSGLVFQP